MFVILLLPSVAVILKVDVPSPSFVCTSLIVIDVFGVLAWSCVIVLEASNWILSTLEPTTTSSILTTSLRSAGSQLATNALLLFAPVVPCIALPAINS